MPNIFSDATIQRYAEEGEEDFARNHRCIVDRLALDIISGTAVYTLPDYVIDIRRLTWKGTKLDPISFRRYKDGLYINSVGTPDCYIYNDIQSQIRFFPSPNISIATTTSNLYGSEIANRVIIEFYRAPDFISFVIPSFFRRRLRKTYVMKSCFSIEGPGFNKKASSYWESKYQFLEEMYGNLLENLINEPRRIIIGGTVNKDYITPRPSLPYSAQGTYVDPGE